MATQPPLTVVMPTYNEEGAIGTAVDEVRREVLDRVPGSGLVVIDDGSTDTTAAVLDRLAADDARIEVHHQPNAGHGPALRAGLERARGEWLLLLDSDAEIGLADFPEHWDEATGRGVAVLGVRRNRQDGWPRRTLSRTIRSVDRLLFGVRLRDANAPYKLVPLAAWERAKEVIPPGTLAPSLFLALYLARTGTPRLEVPVEHRQRPAGVTTLRWGRLLRFCLRAFVQLVEFRARLAA